MKNPPLVLERLGFTEGDGLCYSIEDATNNYERLYMSDALKLGAKAVYFRRFYKKNTPTSDDSDLVAYSKPAVYIFNKKEGFFDSEEHKKLHAALWSAGQAEVYIILTDMRIDILNARQPAKRIKDKKDVTLDDDVLKLASDVIEKFDGERFSAHLFGNGTFWEQSEQKDKLNESSSPYIFLLDYLMKARQKISNEKLEMEASTIDKLLVVSILVKFLEEKKDSKSGIHTLSEIYEKIGVKSFEDVLRKKLCIDVLDKLANKFNGQIFNKFDKKEKKQIKAANLTPIAEFLSAEINLENRQLFLWKQYSFEHLPTEIISAIYENFIQVDALRTGEVKKDVVYTPIHLVNLLIDESMPLDKPDLFANESFKVLDPACGSGVFLVAAYKRMLQWYAINQYNQTGEISYPDKKTSQKILEKNIFGVDIEETAAFVSIFSLTTAFLDKLNPKEIWKNLKFKNLSKENIEGGNFADWAHKNILKKQKFDLVIGNPPFNDSKKGTITNKDLLDLFGAKVPRNKLALKFLESALHFGKKVSMIIPSNVILYNKSKPSQAYRNKIFTNYTVNKIFDFTHLRESLFTKKNPKGLGLNKKTGRTPVVALNIDNQLSEQQSIQHIVVKREYFSEKKIRFEINYYDYHKVPRRWAVDEDKQFVWKTNLLGGGQLFHLIYRLSLLKTFEQFFYELKLTNPNWQYSSGYKIGGDSRDRKNCKFIHGKPTVNGKKRFDKNKNEFDIIIENETKFEAPRNEELYKPPLLVIAKVLGEKIPMQLFDSYQTFNESLIGIHAPDEEYDKLFEIFNRFYIENLTSSLYQVYMLSTSPKLLINKQTTFIKKDFDNLPYPENRDYLSPSISESIIINDVLKYYRNLGDSINLGRKGYPLHQAPKPEDLKAFGETYCNSLNEIYAEDNNSWQIGEVIHTDTFISYQFGFGENGGLKYKYDKKDKVLDFKLLLENYESNRGAMYKRIIRYYDHVNGYDCVYLIKPNSLRYWLKSIALRDAGDTFMDLKKEGF